MKKLLILLVLLSGTVLMAKAPYVEFFLTQYDGKRCLQRAEYALKKSGFKMKGGTFQGEDRVGVKGDFKGAVGCSTEAPTSVVFVVSGPKYNEAKRLGRLLQKYFLNY